MRQEYNKTATAILKAKNIALSSHVNPDGDALGCVLALTHVLRAMGKQTTSLLADGVPEIYSWMPGTEWIQRSTEKRDFDLVIVCDAGALDRVGTSLLPAITSAPLLINIDHHVSETIFGDIQIVDSSAAATAELLWKLILRLKTLTGLQLMSREVADCLMTGLITDTGSFRYLNVTAKSFEIAAKLQRWGASPADIAERVFENRSLQSLKLLGRAMDSLQVTPDGKIAISKVSAKDFSDINAEDAETEGIVANIRSVSGVMVGILLREIPGKKIRVSLRGRDGSDVNKIARVFGGGGHKLAAGCSLDMSLEAAADVLLAEAERQLNSAV